MFRLVVLLLAGTLLAAPSAARAADTGGVSACARGWWGERVAGATVEVVGSALKATTGADGCASLDAVPAGDVVLYVVPPPGARLIPQHSGNESWRADARPVAVRAGQRTTTTIYLPPGDRPYGWDPEGPVGGVVGCLTDAARPTPGVAVLIEHAGGTASATTGADGCFSAIGVRAGPATMRLDPADASGLRLTELVSPYAPTDVPRALDVKPWSWTSAWSPVTGRRLISGTIIDDTGARVPGALVALNGAGVFNQVVTATDGTWSAYAGPGEVSIAVRPPTNGYFHRAYGGPAYEPFLSGTVTGTPVRIAPGADRPGLDVVLPRKARITGRALNAAGRPVNESWVIAWANGVEIGLAMVGPDGQYAMDVVPGTMRLYTRGTYVMTSWHGGSGSYGSATPLTLGPGDHAQGTDLLLRKGGSVTGRVVDTTGRPVAGARVRLEHASPAQADDLAQPWSVTPQDRVLAESVGTDGRGRFSFGYRVPTGRYVVRVAGPAGGDWIETTYGEDVGVAPIPVTVEEPKQRSGVTVTLRRPGDGPAVPPGRVRVSGSVVTLPLACPSGCTVQLRHALKRGKRRGPLLARGRAKAGATQVRVRLTHAGRQEVAHRRLRVVARITPKSGRARSVRLRLPKA